ncbi:MAG TPA: hypothetical protein VD790_01005 [Thermoleophilaceae bacterium]|nr:hypothetical protein [Thermoleophilaceae bacterium]
MVLTEVANVVVVDVSGAGCEDIADRELADRCELTGGELHGFAFVPVAILTAIMAVGAGLGGSRPAGVALLAAGAVVLGIALLHDLPEINSSGPLDLSFADAEGNPGSGFWFEIVAGVLAIAAGALRLLVRAPGRVGRPSAD